METTYYHTVKYTTAELSWYTAAHLYIRVEAGLTQSLPVWTRLKAQLVHAGAESLSADESRAAAIFICSPKNHKTAQF